MLVAILLALIAGGATLLVLTMPTVEHVGPDTLTNDPTPTLELRVVHPVGVTAADVRIRIDGELIDSGRITVGAGGEQVLAQAPRLRDGQHRVEAEIDSAGVLSTTIRDAWTFTVDTQPPSARIIAPAAGADSSIYAPEGVAVVTKLPLPVRVAAEPGARIELASNIAGTPVKVLAGRDERRRTADMTLPQGSQQLTLLATDAAGNETRRAIDVLVDTAGPAVRVQAPPVVRTAALELPISARDAHGVVLTAALDGNELEEALVEVATTPPPGTAPVESAAPEAADGDTSLEPEAVPAPIAGRWKLVLEDGAFEGRHVLEIIATDALGTKTVVTRRFLVDSTEQLDAAAGLRPGARGVDVVQLHSVLVDQQLATRAALAADARARSYGAATQRAVRTFQQSRGMDADGIAGSDTLAGLTLRIVIDRSANQLTLYRMGSVVKRWGVATGSPQYPTPAGDFEIQTMQEHPTWTPPDSEWAKDAEPIPPGPDNPLGTRWMAVNGTVGIHGTNNPASIGYSVSHGCIRMAIPDVEELFAMVAIGTPVSIV